MCLMLNSYRYTAAWIFIYIKKSNVNGNKEREITDFWLYLVLIYFLNDYKNDNLITIRNKYSKL
jgi:hypothetical protein